MKRAPVSSRTIASIGYDPRSRQLEIEFRGGRGVYRYLDVPSDVYHAFMAAESKGAYLNQVLKPRGYRYLTILEGGGG